MKKRIFFTGLLLLLISALVVSAQQRFPRPEFESAYQTPSPSTPEPDSLASEYLDLAILIAALSLASWLALKKRSRKGLLWLSVFSLVWFGFIREGCICPIGAIQNITLALFDSTYKISLTVLLFFLAPLIFALFFGRTFCSSVCPLGAVQDLVIVRPVSLPLWLRKTLGFIPYIYLSLAVLFAATGTDFIICRYDPFVSFFRMDGPFLVIFLGILFLVLGMFFARPYCRVFCPYGVLLNLMSRFSVKHLSITPAECVQCHLCSGSCPFDAIERPTDPKERAGKSSRAMRRKLLTAIVLVPVWIAAGAFAGSKAYIYLSKANQTVALTELLIDHPELKADPDNIDVQTFLQSGKSFEQLYAEAGQVRNSFKKGGWYAGGFLGLVLGLMLVNLLIFRTRKDYEPNRGECFSCGRCMDYCPVGREALPDDINL
ncbi:MAG: 4Fe-4S binding protein [Bacteroidota bacterium]